MSTFLHSIARSRLLGKALFLLAIFHLVVQIAVVAPRELVRTDHDRDMPVYYQAAQAINENRPIYHLQPDYGPGHFPQSLYIYPPPFAAVIAPLGKLSFLQFNQIWFCLILLSFWLFAYCLAILAGNGSWRGVLIWGLIAGLFPGTYTAIGLGQVDPMLWALFAAGLAGLARSSVWALASLIKIFYAWPLLADTAGVIHQGDVKVLLRKFAPAVIILGALILYGGCVCGWQSYVIWIRDVLPTLSQGNFKHDNVSLSFAVLRAARALGWNYAGGPLTWLPHLWLSAASIGAPLLAWWFLRRYDTQIKYASMMSASVLFAPVCWTCYLPLLLPLVALMFRDKQA